MRELDELLLDYLDTRYERASKDEKAAFHAVLELSDPELNSYLLQRVQPESEAINHVIQRILSRTRL